MDEATVPPEQAYLRELSDLGRRHGFGLTGRVQIYQLERDDMAFDYTSDDEGYVCLGASEGLAINSDC